jgi:hypothetical protein
MVSPTQISPSPALPSLGADTFGFTVTIALSETGLVQPFLLHVTVKVPAAFTVIELVVAPVLHKYAPSQALAVKVAVDPGQMALAPLTINFTGIAYTVKLTGFLSPTAVSQVVVLSLQPTV